MKQKTKVTRSKQLELLAKQSKAYGGELLKTRKGRATPRPLATRSTMHLTLRSSKAKGEWSFRAKNNPARIQQIIKKFSERYGVRILSLANVGNHIHIHLKLRNRFTYRAFIRAITAAIAMAVTETSRWRPLKKSPKDKFWDYRPYSRVVESFRAYLNLRDYIRINQWEGFACDRSIAQELVRNGVFAPPSPVHIVSPHSDTA